MHITKNWILLKALPVLVVFLTLSCATHATAKEMDNSFKVIILPFEIGASGKFDYLRNGLRTVLTSRLAAKIGIAELDYASYKTQLEKLKKTSGKKEAGALLRKLKIDYLVSGTLYSLQESLRLELTFYPASQGDQVAGFIATASGGGDVFEAIETVTIDIAEKVFGIQKESLSVDEKVNGDGLSGFETAHPERIFKKGIYSAVSLQGSQAGKLITSKNVRRSPRISSSIVAMDVTDINHDGREEIIISSRDQIGIYHFEEGNFKEVDTIDLPGYLKAHAVNMVDLDQNGTDEIVVSASNQYQPSSSIIEWKSAGSVSYIVRDAPYYLRPVDMGDGSPMTLIGQQGVDDISEEKTVVKPGLYRLNLNKGVLEVGDELQVPESVNLFDFSYIDLDGDTVAELVVVDAKEKMLVYSHDKKLLWVSEEDFGGSLRYFGPPLIKDKEGLDRDYSYIPPRIIKVDIDDDQKPEVLIGRNKRSTLSDYRFLPNSRDYDGGFLSCLAWNGKSMIELWRTNMLDGYIADYQFQLNNELVQKDSAQVSERGAKLWIAQVQEGGLLDFFSSSKGGNRILEYQLAFPRKTADNKEKEQ